VGRPAFIGLTRRRLLAWPTALAFLTGACAGRPLPTPLPTPEGGGIPPREVIIDLGGKQVYDTNPGASARGIVYAGVEVTIQPQDGAYRQTEARLGHGAIVAVLINHSRNSVRELALAPSGRSYWVVYRRKEWYSAFIADSPDGRGLDRVGVPTMVHYSGRPWRQSIAQWQLTGVLQETRPGGGMFAAWEVVPWVTCMQLGCCRPGI
jgi:hypothetical protein